MNRCLLTSLIHMSLEFREREKECVIKIVEEIMAKINIIWLINLRSSVNPKEDNTQNTLTRLITVRLPKTRNKEKVLKGRQVNKSTDTMRQTMAKFSLKTMEKTKEWHCRSWKKKLSTFYTCSKNISQQTFSDKQKLREFFVNRHSLQEFLKEIL